MTPPLPARAKHDKTKGVALATPTTPFTPHAFTFQGTLASHRAHMKGWHEFCLIFFSIPEFTVFQGGYSITEGWGPSEINIYDMTEHVQECSTSTSAKSFCLQQKFQSQKC